MPPVNSTHQSLLHLGLDVLRQREERLLHVDGRLGGRLHELDPVLYGQLLPPLPADLPPVVHVALVAEDHLLHVGGGVLLDVADPVLDVVEALLVGDVVDEHDAHGPAVVGRGDGAEPLLAGRVPDLQLDLLPVKLDRADLEVDSCGASNKGLFIRFFLKC